MNSQTTNGSVKTFFNKLGIDLRLLGMIGALVILCVMFDLITGGRFLTPRNLFNLSVQTASVAVMATGMVFVIVTRNIDLSVGSMLGFIGMTVGALQVYFFPDIVGLGQIALSISRVSVFIFVVLDSVNYDA